MNRRCWPCVSLFMPTHRFGNATRQDPIRFKNKLRETETLLTETGLRRPEVAALLEPAWTLASDDLFWMHQGDGLALFAAPDLFRCYRVPMALKPLLAVSWRPHIKPLLPLLSRESRFFVLAVSQTQVRLFEATADGVRPLDLGAAPADLEEALQLDVIEEQRQFHSIPEQGGPGTKAIAHGHGAGTSAAKKKRAADFLRQVARGVEAVLEGQQRTPLIFAGVESLFSLYRSVSHHPHLFDQPVAGNPDELTPEDLQQEAWALLEPGFEASHREATERFLELAGTGLTSTNVETVLRAAHEGSVDTLLVSGDDELWGRFDPKSRAVHLGRSSRKDASEEDLLDRAALDAMRTGAAVFVVGRGEVPERAPLAAILRYPVAEPEERATGR